MNCIDLSINMYVVISYYVTTLCISNDVICETPVLDACIDLVALSNYLLLEVQTGCSSASIGVVPERPSRKIPTGVSLWIVVGVVHSYLLADIVWAPKFDIESCIDFARPMRPIAPPSKTALQVALSQMSRQSLVFQVI